MIHDRQRLPLGLEAGHHLLGVHARLEDLQRDLATDRLLLLGHEDDAETTLANLLQQLVGPDDRAGAFGGHIGRYRRNRRARGEKAVGLRVSRQEPLDTPPQVGVIAADPVKVGGTLRERGQFEGVAEDTVEFGFGSVHDLASTIPVKDNASFRPDGGHGKIKKSVGGGRGIADGSIQPGTRICPVPLGGPVRDAQHSAGLFQGQTGEVMQLEEFSLGGFLAGEFFRCLIQSQQVVVRNLSEAYGLVQADAVAPASAVLPHFR